MNRTKMQITGWGLLVVVLGLLASPIQADSPYNASAPATAKPTYLRSPLLRLPLAPLPEAVRTTIREIKLYVKTPGADWKCVATGVPTQTLFDYRAEKDGEYAFKFVTVDREGRSNAPALDTRPDQVVVVDTQAPRLGVILAAMGNKNERVLKVEMTDANPDWTTVKLDYLEGTQWKPFPEMGKKTPGVFLIPDFELLKGKIRISATDLALNVGTRLADFSDETQPLNLTSQQKAPASAAPVDIPIESPAHRLNEKTTQANFTPDMNLIGNDALLKKGLPELSEPVKLPDLKSEPDAAFKIPTAPDSPKQVALGGPPVSARDVKIDPFMPAMELNTPLNPAPAVKSEPTPTPKTDAMMRPASVSDTAAPVGGKHAILNAPRCNLEYAVETTPFAGPPRVEFYATRDNGQSWQKLVDETPGHSPAKLLLPGEGYFGIKARTNGNGQPTKTDVPDAYVEVDVTKPVVNLLPVNLGTGAELGTLTLQWSAQDKNLTTEPISLYYKTKADSQWKLIAARLKNDGSFRWSVPQGLGTEVYLLMEARDRAGNVGRCELSEPVVLPQPKVTVLGVGPAQ